MSANFKFRLIALVSRLAFSPAEQVGPVKGRADLLKSSAGSPFLLGRRPPGVEVSDSSVAGIGVRRYRPTAPRRGVIVYFHGGGWMMGSVVTHDILTAQLAASSGHEVVSVEYRLAPEHPYPAGLDDCLAVTRALLATQEPVAVAGDSAGGNLAAVVANRLPVVAQLLLYPVVDSSCERPSYERFAVGHILTAATMRYLRQAYQPNPALRADSGVSPLLEPDLSHSKPAFVAVAECDVLRDEGAAYAQRLREAGVAVHFEEVAGVMHGFVSLLGLKEARECLERGALWLQQRFAMADRQPRP